MIHSCILLCESTAPLPALHLPNGDLLHAAAISTWISKNGSQQDKQKKKDGYTVDSEDKSVDAGAEKADQEEGISLQARTYKSLVESKLQPALVRTLRQRVHNAM